MNLKPFTRVVPHPDLGWVWIKWEDLTFARLPKARLTMACATSTREDFSLSVTVEPAMLGQLGEAQTLRGTSTHLFHALKAEREGEGVFWWDAPWNWQFPFINPLLRKGYETRQDGVDRGRGTFPPPQPLPSQDGAKTGL